VSSLTLSSNDEFPEGRAKSIVTAAMEELAKSGLL